jgi:hypothetical protein
MQELMLPAPLHARHASASERLELRGRDAPLERRMQEANAFYRTALCAAFQYCERSFDFW